MTPLYHFTDIACLGEILEQDQLGTDGSVSLTRDARHGFADKAQVCLVLDREALRQNHALSLTRGDGSKRFARVLSDECEERVERPVKGLSRYLREIVVTDRVHRGAREAALWAETGTQAERYARDHEVSLAAANFKHAAWRRQQEMLV